MVPVQIREIWFWSLGDISVDSWDIRRGERIFWDGKGKLLSQDGHLQYRAVLFKALGIEQGGLNQTSWKHLLGDSHLKEVHHQAAWRPEGTTAAAGLGKRPVGMKGQKWNVLALERAK